MKIYLASSWKNEGLILKIAEELRKEGHEVDAFVDTESGRFVFSFAELDKVIKEGANINIKDLNCKDMLEYPCVIKAFKEDKKWLDWCDCCVMLLPCGNSSHLEAGYAKGNGKKLIIFNWGGLKKGSFDVMYGFADLITEDWNELESFLKEQDHEKEKD